MKRGRKALGVILFVFLIAMLLVNFVSASFLSDIYNNLFGGKTNPSYSGELNQVKPGTNEGYIVAHYPLDNNFYNRYGGTPLGQCSGLTCPNKTTGKVNGSYSFDGVDDFISFPDFTNGFNKFTFSAWIEPENTGDWGTVLTKGNFWNDYWFAIKSWGDDRGKVEFRMNSQNFSQMTNSRITYNQWNHVAVSYDGSNVKFYINGILDKSVSYTGNLVFTSNPFLIGKEKGGYPFKGRIDEVKIWNYALSDSDIKDDYNSAAGPTCTPNCNSKTCGDDGCSGSCGTCTSTQTCTNGNCVNNPPTGICTDSDSSLNNFYYIKGVVNDNSGEGPFTDYCSDDTLAEYYCKSYSCPAGTCIKADYEKFVCPNGCSSGACIYSNITKSGCDNCKAPNYCVDNKYCINDTCSPDTRICSAINGYRVCSQNSQWGNEMACPTGQVCDHSNGNCIFQCNNLQMVWDDSNRADNYDYLNDSCNGFRCLIGSSISPSCYNSSQCKNACNGYCVDINDAKNKCNNPDKLICPDGTININGSFCYSKQNDCYETWICGKFGCICKDNCECHLPQKCTETDLGNNKYTKGITCIGNECDNDTCWIDNYNNTYLREFYCSDNGDYINRNEYIRCSEGCVNGACPKVEVPTNEVCQNLIEKIANPKDISIYDIKYTDGGWSNHYSGTMNINNKDYTYQEYYSSYNAYQNNQASQDQYKYQNTYLGFDITVFDDKTIDLDSYMKQMLSYNICQIYHFWNSENQESLAYICSWDILNNRQSLDSYSSKSRQVIWYNKNVIVNVNINDGESLTNAELQKLSNDRLNEFVSDLKDNQNKYVEWSNFDISYLSRTLIEDSINGCPSMIKQPLYNGTNETCYPSWSCKLEPAICPEYGHQTRTCVDNGCNEQKRTEELFCSPGICSGCYVPRWFGDKNNLDNVCIPYGTRFSQPTENIIQKLVEDKSDQQLSSNQDHDYRLDVISEKEAILTIYGQKENYTYTLTPGNTVEIKIPDFGSEIESFELYTKAIYYSSQEGVNNYVDVTLTSKRWSKSYEEINVYCNYDGNINKQKTVDSNNDWAKCQNNYECESNVCSSGECIEVQKMINKVSGFKGIFAKVFCKVAHLLNVQNYNKCVISMTQ